MSARNSLNLIASCVCTWSKTRRRSRVGLRFNTVYCVLWYISRISYLFYNRPIYTLDPVVTYFEKNKSYRSRNPTLRCNYIVPSRLLLKRFCPIFGFYPISSYAIQSQLVRAATNELAYRIIHIDLWMISRHSFLSIAYLLVILCSP